MYISNYLHHQPKIAKNAYITPHTVIVGDVTIGEYSSVWYGTVVRGDVEKIVIGDHTNIQDNSMIHVNRNQGPTLIGNSVTIGHNCLLHACILKDFTFVGMSSTVMDFATIEEFGMLGAGSLLTKGKVIKTGELWVGNPAKFFRKMTSKETEFIKQSAINYRKLSEEYMNYQKDENLESSQ